MNRKEARECAKNRSRVIDDAGAVGTVTGYQVGGPRVMVLWDGDAEERPKPVLPSRITRLVEDSE